MAMFSPRDLPHRLRGGLAWERVLAEVATPEEEMLASVPAQWFNQVLNHSDPDSPTFKQKCVVVVCPSGCASTCVGWCGLWTQVAPPRRVPGVPSRKRARAAVALFERRYYVNDQYFDAENGPVFLGIKGEGPNDGPVGGWVNDLAKQHNALTISVEHRFYGVCCRSLALIVLVWGVRCDVRTSISWQGRHMLGRRQRSGREHDRCEPCLPEPRRRPR